MQADEAAARKLLEAVAARYAALKTLAANLVFGSDSEGTGQRHETRAQARYAAPDKVRVEQGSSRRGTVMVCDGTFQHDYLGAAGARYMKTPLAGRTQQTGRFSPEFPANGAPVFLFHRVAERVASARMLQDDSTAGGVLRVLSVQYMPPDAPPGPPRMTFSDVRLWIDPPTYLVMRMELDMTHRLPVGMMGGGAAFEEETERARLSWVYSYAAVDEPMAAGTFEFTPPPGVEPVSMAPGGGGGGRIFGSSSGSRQAGSDEKSGNRYELEGSTNLQPDGALVERGKVRLNGAEVAIERRMQLAADRKSITVTQKVTGIEAGEARITVAVKPPAP